MYIIGKCNGITKDIVKEKGGIYSDRKEIDNRQSCIWAGSTYSSYNNGKPTGVPKDTDDKIILGYNSQGLPFQIVADGYDKCVREKVFTFIDKHVTPLMVAYAKDLAQSDNPEEITEKLIATIRQKSRQLDFESYFTLSLAMTYENKEGKLKCSGFGIGDTGIAVKQEKDKKLKQLVTNNFFDGNPKNKDGFDSTTELKTVDSLVERNAIFTTDIEPGDEIVGYTYVDDELEKTVLETNVTAKFEQIGYEFYSMKRLRDNQSRNAQEGKVYRSLEERRCVLKGAIGTIFNEKIPEEININDINDVLNHISKTVPTQKESKVQTVTKKSLAIKEKELENKSLFKCITKQNKIKNNEKHEKYTKKNECEHYLIYIDSVNTKEVVLKKLIEEEKLENKSAYVFYIIEEQLYCSYIENGQEKAVYDNINVDIEKNKELTMKALIEKLPKKALKEALFIKLQEEDIKTIELTTFLTVKWGDDTTIGQIFVPDPTLRQTLAFTALNQTINSIKENYVDIKNKALEVVNLSNDLIKNGENVTKIAALTNNLLISKPGDERDNAVQAYRKTALELTKKPLSKLRALGAAMMVLGGLTIAAGIIIGAVGHVFASPISYGLIAGGGGFFLTGLSIFRCGKPKESEESKKLDESKKELGKNMLELAGDVDKKKEGDLCQEENTSPKIN